MHASVEGNYRGFRATVADGNRVVASRLFPVEPKFKGFSDAVDRAYREVKEWLASFGLK